MSITIHMMQSMQSLITSLAAQADEGVPKQYEKPPPPPPP